MARFVATRSGLLVVLVLVAMLALLAVRQQQSNQALPDHLTCKTVAVGKPNLVEPTTLNPRVQLRELAVVDQPTDAAMRHGDNHVYVSSRIGKVIRIAPDGIARVALDLGTLDLTWQGAFMSLTFDPSGNYLYVNYTVDRVNRVVAYPVDAAGTIAETGVEILSVEQPVDVHNFGALVFGPDGHLYISSGDGGNNTDLPDIRGDGQNIGTIFSGILRIAPDPVGGGYTIPSDNPFVGVDGAAEELWTTGFRNPWRFSFDSATNDLWIGDVGQWCWEEVNHIAFSAARGANFGWSGYEGFHEGAGERPDRHVLPIYEYRRAAVDDGRSHCAVIGGFVYNGEEIPGLVGSYVFSDYCAQQLETLRLGQGGVVEWQTLTDVGGLVQSISQDPDGELLVLTSNAVLRLGPHDR